MKPFFASYITNRFLLSALAYEMLDKEWNEITSGNEIRSMVATLLVEPHAGFYGDTKTVDEFLRRVDLTGLVVVKNGRVQWRSLRTQAYLAGLELYARWVGWRSNESQSKTAALLQEKAAVRRWHESIAMMSDQVRDAEEALSIVRLLTPIAPSLTARYQELLEERFYETPLSDREFLSEIAWPLGDISFWKALLKDDDPDTRRQATLVLGVARVADIKELLLELLNDVDDQVRARAVWALGQLASVDVARHLTALMSDSSQRVRFQVHQVLALIQGDGRKSESTTRFPVDESERAGKKILISDDEPEILELCKLILAKAGYQALCALGGEETLEVTGRERPDLIITDILNLHMRGTDLILELKTRATTRNTPLVVLSAYHMPWLGVFLGADAYIRKPMGPKELVQPIDEILFA